MTVAFSILVAFSVSASAATTVLINFDGLDDRQYIGTHYLGLTFASEAQIVKKPNYNWEGYPPHSGSNVFYNHNNADTRIDFDSQVSRVGIWYTSPIVGNIHAYDSTGTLIDSASGGANYGRNDYLEVCGSNIAYVIVHDGGNFITYDDLEYDTYDTDEIPEFSTIALPIASILGLLFFFNHRKHRKE